MYILKNAFQNLGRNKKRNLLLGVILFALIVSTTVALVINSTTNEIIKDYKNRFGAKVILSVDFDKLMSENKPNGDLSFAFPSAPEISPEQYISFADSELLKSYMMEIKKGIVFDNLKAVGEKDNDNMMGSIGGGSTEYVSPKAKLLSYSETNQMEDFIEGLRKIVDGEIFKNKNECIVSSDFAELNNLKVGSEFEITDSTNKDKKIKLKVTGIYADATKATGDLPPGSMSLEGSYGNRRNEIIVNQETMLTNFEKENLVVDAEYELLSPDLVKDFEKEVRAKGLPDAYIVGTDENAYNKIVAPVVGLADVSINFMVIILLVGSCVLLFVTNLVIQERKYEIGVLRAIGLKKFKVACMIVSEIIMITVVALVLGLTVGSLISQPIANVLIKDQSKIDNNNGNLGSGMIGSIGDNSDVTPLDKIDVSLTSEATIQIVFVSLGLALIASMSGVIFITKYEPMKILSERSQ